MQGCKDRLIVVRCERRVQQMGRAIIAGTDNTNDIFNITDIPGISQHGSAIAQSNDTEQMVCLNKS